MRISNENIEIIQNYFKDKPVLKAYLFGSFARGDADSQSDFDILVELDYSKIVILAIVGFGIFTMAWYVATAKGII